MVFLTLDWRAFKEYATNCRLGTYQVKETTEGLEVRVRTGKLGFKTHIQGAIEKDEPKFADPKDEDVYNEIIEFCKLQGFTQVVGSIPDEQFHN